MKILAVLTVLLFNLYGNSEYAKSNTCKGCHPVIYSEFYNSMHRKSSIFQDKIHNAVWDMHPDKKEDKYSCAKCHTPSDLELLENLKEQKAALPKKSNTQEHEAISCVYCHSIKTIKEHKHMNENILNSKDKIYFSADKEKRSDKEVSFKESSSFFGMFKKKEGSPYHKIDYSNEGFYSAKSCMGCHSHLQNKNGVDLCRVELDTQANDQKNCIECHMPKVKGSSTTIKRSATHRYHGFAGVHNKPELLEKYIKLEMIQNSNGFEIVLENEASHDLFLQPLRVAKLNITVSENGKSIKLKPVTFVKVFAKEGKPALPWDADGIYKNTMIKANEKRSIKYDYKLQKGNVVEATLGYYLVNPKMAKKLKLDTDNNISKFHVLKQRFFNAK